LNENHSDTLDKWRERWRLEVQRSPRGKPYILETERQEYAYCKMKTPCEAGFKVIKKAKSKKGLYYVICHNPSGCNQKTFYPQKIDTTKGDQL